MTLQNDPQTGKWAEERPPDRAWKGKAGRTREAIAAEQDRAAGGREWRWRKLEDGRHARASVELKLPKSTRRVRAYLRWSDNGRSPAIYIGEVHQATRSANLREAWAQARATGFVTQVTQPATSWASSTAVRVTMQANKARDTGPEKRLRTLLHKAGLRYRVAAKPLPRLRRTADVLFPALRVAVFVDGCFWHGCPQHYRPATRNNSEFWRQKIEGNRERDADTDRLLTDAGWQVVRIWEHEDPATAATLVTDLVRSRRESLHGRPL
jgi:DNA mismatch endonuclease (patch repair protein)